MDWLGRFRKKKAKKQGKELNALDFGRFSDAFKPTKNYQYWEESLLLFDQGKRFSSFQLFFKYLTNEKGKNVIVSQLHGVLKFELIQGSKRILGSIDAQKIHAHAVLIRSIAYPSELLIELLQENYNLKFCKYALAMEDGGYVLKLIADLPAKLTSPYKLYHVLRELALAADKKDDLLLSKYHLSTSEYGHLNEPLPRVTKDVLSDFVQTTFRKVLEVRDEHEIDTEEYPSAFRYLLLAAVYKVDFLVKPEGVLMDSFEQIDGLAFSSQAMDAKIVNRKIVTIIEEILQMESEQIKQELYHVDATFSFNPVIQSAQIRDTINSELPTMDWYLEKGYDEYAVAIVDFIIGYLLFNFIVPPPCKALFLLYYRIREPKFFKELGYIDLSFSERKLSGAVIKKEVKKILADYSSRFPHLDAPTNYLEFDSAAVFGKSYLEMVAEINFTPK